MNTNYRADVEGLRALAILAVVACHAKFPFLQGGFIGVDIFFVLSGYLITGMLVREIELTGKINFLTFYARRLKRLLPGLALMLVVSSIAAYVLLAPYEQPAQAQIATSSFLWFSNFRFIEANAGYFDSVSLNLFLHTWSLAVEEQFYLVWPLLILMFVRSKQTTLLTWLILVFVCCLALSVVLSNAAPLWGFYSMPSRGWQFALGGIVSVVGTEGLPAKYYSMQTRGRAGFVGIGLILFSALMIREQMSYPGVAALLPSMGAALTLFAKESATAKALSVAPMQGIGKVSYSWYLWHWPVLVLGNAAFNRFDIGFQLSLVFISLLLAWLSYNIIEKPVRYSKLTPRVVIAASVVLTIGGILASSAWTRHAIFLSNLPSQMAYINVRGTFTAVYTNNCDSYYSSAELKPCRFGRPDAEKTAVLIGDSVAAQWFTAFGKIYVDAGWNLIVLTKSACPMADELLYNEQVRGMFTVCSEWRNSAIAYLAQIKPDAIFLGSSTGYEIQDWKSGTERILAPLAESAGKVYIIRSTPALDFDSTRCLARRDWQPAFLIAFYDCSSVVHTIPDNDIFLALQEASANFDNVRILDFNELVCPNGVCSARNDDMIVFRDTTHVTNQFVRSITSQIQEKITEVD